MNRDITVSNIVRSLRIESCLTQQRLAELIAVSRQTVSSIEGGRCCISLELAFRIAHVFRVPVEHDSYQRWRQGVYRGIEDSLSFEGEVLTVEQQCQLAEVSRAGFYRSLQQTALFPPSASHSWGALQLRLAAEGFTAARLSEKLCRTSEADIAHPMSKVSVRLMAQGAGG